MCLLKTNSNIDHHDKKYAFSSSDPGHRSFRHPHCGVKEWFEQNVHQLHVPGYWHGYTCDGMTYNNNLKYLLYQTMVKDDQENI